MEKKQRINKISDISDRSDRTVRRETASVKNRKRSVSHGKKKRRQKQNRAGRLIQCGLILALFLVLFYVVRNFGEANKFNNKGIEAYEQADYETAASYFAQAIARDGNNSEYYMNQGMAQSELKMYDAAMTSFEQAAEHTRKSSDLQLINRAKGISLMYQGKYSDALEAFDLALDDAKSKLTGTEIDILYYKAETQDKAEMYVEAALTYTQIVDATKSADAYMLRGMEYMKVGDSSSAESDLRTAIKKDKKNYDIYLSLYQALKAQNKTKDAELVLQEALELGGNKGTALVSQGEIYMELGDFTSSEEKLQKALKKGEVSANLGLGKLYMAKPEPDYVTASQYFETYLAEVTTNAEAYNEYGLCLMAMENYEKAEEILAKGTALNDRFTDREISKNLIVAAENAGHWENTLEYINVYLQKYSDDTEAVKEKDFILTRIR